MSPLSTIFLIYHDGYFLLAYKTIDRPQVTDIVHHIKMYRINIAMDENRTHNFKEKSLNIHMNWLLFNTKWPICFLNYDVTLWWILLYGRATRGVIIFTVLAHWNSVPRIPIIISMRQQYLAPTPCSYVLRKTQNILMSRSSVSTSQGYNPRSSALESIH